MLKAGPLLIAEEVLSPLIASIVEAWYGGEEAGTAIADQHLGSAGFSGRLPVTFPLDHSQLPYYTNLSLQAALAGPIATRRPLLCTRSATKRHYSALCVVAYASQQLHKRTRHNSARFGCTSFFLRCPSPVTCLHPMFRCPFNHSCLSYTHCYTVGVSVPEWRGQAGA